MALMVAIPFSHRCVTTDDIYVNIADAKAKNKSGGPSSCGHHDKTSPAVQHSMSFGRGNHVNASTRRPGLSDCLKCCFVITRQSPRGLARPQPPFLILIYIDTNRKLHLPHNPKNPPPPKQHFVHADDKDGSSDQMGNSLYELCQLWLLNWRITVTAPTCHNRIRRRHLRYPGRGILTARLSLVSCQVVSISDKDASACCNATKAPPRNT